MLENSIVVADFEVYSVFFADEMGFNASMKCKRE
jgi:hypothetical protein